MSWDEAVFRITGLDPMAKPQGTGFVVAQHENLSLVVTCWHVVKTIGRDRLRIKSQPCRLVSSEGDDTLDLAVLSVAGLPSLKPLRLSSEGRPDLAISIYGYGPEGRPLNGTLGQQTRWAHVNRDDLTYWDYYLDGQAGAFERIKDGYSGSPLYDPVSKQVIAVVTHRVGENKGFAIDVRELLRVYPGPATWLPPPRTGQIGASREGISHPRPPPSIRADALAEIADTLSLLAPLREALSQAMTGGTAETAQMLAERLCPVAPDDFKEALGHFIDALDEVQVLIRRARVEAAPLREGAAFILGWMLVTTVLDDYEHEATPAVQAWLDEGRVLLQVPFGRTHCVEVLFARWLRHQARFGSKRYSWCTGEDDLMDRPLGELGFDHPFERDSRRLVDTIWKLIHQKLWPDGSTPSAITPEMRERISTRMELKRRDRNKQHRRWFRLVVDPTELEHAAFSQSALRAIASEIPLLQLIRVGVAQSEGAAPDIFLLPPGELAGKIDECLERIDSLS